LHFPLHQFLLIVLQFLKNSLLGLNSRLPHLGPCHHRLVCRRKLLWFFVLDFLLVNLSHVNLVTHVLEVLGNSLGQILALVVLC
jgi:hypothetical protein